MINQLLNMLQIQSFYQLEILIISMNWLVCTSPKNWKSGVIIPKTSQASNPVWLEFGTITIYLSILHWEQSYYLLSTRLFTIF
uniref:Uncharacterized protein n=1 Tax=Pyxicephalus adspersus TaxID=30357 RepID=A0AAV2ZUJ9_PYXAD|nr:TPA: hypothetical protein GDO54_013213 [Pyxicephalus adspersus]